MAIDNRLQIYDEQGNLVDYDIMATDVKFSDGKDLPTKLAEAGGYEPPVGGIPKEDLASGVQASLDKADTAVQDNDYTHTDNNYTDAEKTKLAGIESGAEVNVINGIKTHDNQPLAPDANGVVTLPEGGGGGGLTEEDIDVSTQEDGVVVMTFGNDSYSINLNHLHSQYLQAQVLTQAAYDALTTKDSKTLYFISDGNKLYLGSSLVLDASNSGGGGGDDPTPDPDPEPTDSLPSGYTALEWLNGNGAVEINTTQAIPFDVETKFAPTDLSGYSVICGRVSSLMVAWNAQGQAWVGNANSSLSPAPFALNTDAVVTAKFRADSAESEVKINGTDSGLHRATSADSSAFSILSNGSSYKAKGKLYYLKVYNASSGTLEKHLVPALDDNNTPCLYDIIGQTKYTFSGTVSSITTNLS